LLNQFSLWPRYDEFVATASKPTAGGNDEETDTESGANPFAGRSALFIRDGVNGKVVRNISAAFQSADPIATVEVRYNDRHVRTWRIFLCRYYKTLPL
jgi:hypothetical protein